MERSKWQKKLFQKMLSAVLAGFVALGPSLAEAQIAGCRLNCSLYCLVFPLAEGCEDQNACSLVDAFVCYLQPMIEPFSVLNSPTDDTQSYESPLTPLCPGSGKQTQDGSMSAGDPVLLDSGEFYYGCTDLVVPGRGLDVAISHFFRGGKNYNKQFGYGWSINYDERLLVTQNDDVLILHGDGREKRYIYDINTQIYSPPVGYFEKLTPQGDGTWILMDPQGSAKTYGPQGNLVAITDRHGNQIRFEYTPQRQWIFAKSQYSTLSTAQPIVSDYLLTKIIDTVGREIFFTYNAQNKLERITDHAGREVSFSYDNEDNLIQITKPATTVFPQGVSKSFTYDNQHNLATITDAKGQVYLSNVYDAKQRVIEQTLGQAKYTFSYNTSASETTVTDRNGNQRIVRFLAQSVPIFEEIKTRGVRPNEPAGYVDQYVYSPDFKLLEQRRPNQNGVQFVYDDNHPDPLARSNLIQLRQVQDFNQPGDYNDLTTRFSYEPMFNQLQSLTDPKGYRYDYVYDYQLSPTDPDYGTSGHLIEIKQPSVNGTRPVTRMRYNSYGQVVEVTDPNGHVWAYTYHPTTGYLHEMIADPGGIHAVTTHQWDAYGQIDTVTDPAGATVDYDFDALGWLRQITEPDGHVTRFDHDANGNVIAIHRQADAAATVWQTTVMEYDLLDNLVAVTDPLSRRTEFDYDNNENRIRVLDAENNATLFSYDERDLLFTTTDAKTAVVARNYDGNGNLTELIDGENNQTDYRYDGFNRRIKTTYADGSFERFNFDRNSNLTRYTALDGETIDYLYDELNRRTDKMFSHNPTWNTSYSYDPASRLLTAANAASMIDHSYDALNRLTQVTQSNGAGVFTFEYHYDAKGRKKRVDYPSGTQLDYGYDVDDKLVTITRDGSLEVSYGYDVLDRRSSRTFNGSQKPTTTYQYDIANQLLTITNALNSGGSVSSFGYGYDQVGNRETMTTSAGVHHYGYNEIYELESVTGAQTHNFDYDLVGNRVTADGISYVDNVLNQYTQVGSQSISYDANANLINDGSNSYTYDSQNRLQTATNGNTSATYSYDPFNRRVSKTVNGVTTYFIYDGDEAVAEYNDSGVLQAEYITGANLDEWLTMDRAGQRYYYHHDALGSVTEITDSTGVIAESYTYTPFGQPSVTASVIGNDYMFTGRRWDEETALQYSRARTYDPTIGRFLQRDPLGYYDSMNMYSYVTNNPINLIDPFGLSPRYDQRQGELGRRADGLTGVWGDAFGREFGASTIDQFQAGIDFWKNAHTGVEFGPQPGSGADTAGKLGGCGAKTATQIASGVAIVATLTAIAGPPSAWIRLGSSYSKSLGSKTKLSLRLGSNQHHASQKIGSSLLQKVSKWLKYNFKFPGNGWRVNDPGHFHIFK